MRRIEVNKSHATYEELMSLYRTENNARIKIRLLAILYFYDGYTSVEVGKLVKQSDSTVREFLHRYNKKGIHGLRDIPHPPKECKITDDELKLIDEILKGKPSDVGLKYNNWTAKILIEWIKNKFNKVISSFTAYRILHKLNYSKTRAKKLSKNIDIEAVEAFREEVCKLLENKSEDTVVLYQDEAIITSEPTATSVWTKVGEQAIVETKGGTRQRRVIFGAVNPENGDLIEEISEAGNTDNFKSFLKYTIIRV